MTTTSPPITESDLLAYVDGRLEQARRREVEDHLRAHPEDNERVTADIAIQAGLRLLFGNTGRPLAAREGKNPQRRTPWPTRTALMLALLMGAFAGGWCGARVGLGMPVPTTSAALSR